VRSEKGLFVGLATVDLAYVVDKLPLRNAKIAVPSQHVSAGGPAVTAHGHTIAYAIEHRSKAVLQVEHGSLYPGLHRLEDRGWIASSWGASENNRKARFYRLTAKGRKQLAKQTSRWNQLVSAVNQILRPAEE
jgi:PadR family transcriptional regulator, regulatory protein PadR